MPIDQKARFLSIGCTLAAALIAAGNDVLMNRYDRFTTGANTHETVLSASNVNGASFGKLYSFYVDGAVYAQPLYANGVLYVATMNDKVYAFHAARPGPPPIGMARRTHRLRVDRNRFPERVSL
jgi:hypothetical protein